MYSLFVLRMDNVLYLQCEGIYSAFQRAGGSVVCQVRATLLSPLLFALNVMYSLSSGNMN